MIELAPFFSCARINSCAFKNTGRRVEGRGDFCKKHLELF